MVMHVRTWIALFLAGAIGLAASHALACCPAPPSGKPVVNADQTVILIWDAANQKQHFIRQASFLGEADDFGFIVPSPSQPELSESGNEAFPHLLKLTEPEIVKQKRPSNVGCCLACSKVAAPKEAAVGSVRVLDEKQVAGFKAVILEASTAGALVEWLKANGYAYSPAIEAWAKPYVEKNWKFTALKVAKGPEDKAKKNVAAAALRMTFTTDRPLFPYREPDAKSVAEKLNAKDRMLRIYFVAEARYKGEPTKEVPWTGKVAWANKVAPEERKKTLELLKLPENTGPAEWWLTEFEDNWPYSVAPADVYFSRDADQSTVKRPPIIQYVTAPWPTEVTVYAIAALVAVPVVRRAWRRRVA
jgi:hypothetical protein